jgi:hypothetical protein
MLPTYYRIEKWHRDNFVDKVFDFKKKKLRLGVDVSQPGTVSDKLFRLRLSNTADIELIYRNEVLSCNNTMNTVYQCYTGYLYYIVFGLDSVSKMPRPETDPKHLTTLGVLLARALYHNIVLKIDINKRFFQLMLDHDSYRQADDHLHFMKVNSLFANKITSGEYDVANE